MEQRVGRDSLTLSKSIAVMSQVPIQFLLEEKGTEPERSPWEDPPQTHTNPLYHWSLDIHYPYLSISHYWSYMAALMKDRILHYSLGVCAGCIGGGLMMERPRG